MFRLALDWDWKRVFCLKRRYWIIEGILDVWVEERRHGVWDVRVVEGGYLDWGVDMLIGLVIEDLCNENWNWGWCFLDFIWVSRAFWGLGLNDDNKSSLTFDTVWELIFFLWLNLCVLANCFPVLPLYICNEAELLVLIRCLDFLCSVSNSCFFSCPNLFPEPLPLWVLSLFCLIIWSFCLRSSDFFWVS